MASAVELFVCLLCCTVASKWHHRLPEKKKYKVIKCENEMPSLCAALNIPVEVEGPSSSPAFGSCVDGGCGGVWVEMMDVHSAVNLCTASLALAGLRKPSDLNLGSSRVGK